MARYSKRHSRFDTASNNLMCFWVGKRRLNFASFTTKEHLNFPVATHYHVDIIAHENFLTGKFNADWCQILKAVFQRITHWEHEDILDAMQTRLDNAPDSMRIRRQTVEHPLGTLKAWMGATHFLIKTLKNVSTEMSLHVLAYNMKRAMSILGTPAMIEAIRI